MIGFTDAIISNAHTYIYISLGHGQEQLIAFLKYTRVFYLYYYIYIYVRDIFCIQVNQHEYVFINYRFL